MIITHSFSRYDYDLCDKNSDDEYSDSDDAKGDLKEIMKNDSINNDGEDSENNPFGVNHAVHSDISAPSKERLPKSISDALNGFSKKMSKTKSFRMQLNN